MGAALLRTEMTFDSDFYDSDEMLERHERRIVRCTHCRKKIIWLRTKRLRMMPFDADTVEPSDMDLDLERHVSHFATCKMAKDYRDKRR